MTALEKYKQRVKDEAKLVAELKSYRAELNANLRMVRTRLEQYELDLIEVDDAIATLETGARP